MEKTFHKKKEDYIDSTKKGHSVNGFLEDYSHLIAYYLDAYETFFDLHYLIKPVR